MSKVNLKIAPKRCPTGQESVQKARHVSRLKHEPTAEALCNDLNKKLENLTLGDAIVEDDWKAFKDIVYSTAFEHLGPSKQHNQDWFDENDAEITSLIAKKRCLLRQLQSDPHSASKKAAFANICKEVQSMLHKMQDEWLSKKAAMLISMT